jgi:monoamine oxidase
MTISYMCAMQQQQQQRKTVPANELMSHEKKKERCQVVIVGAGACGLQACAHLLLQRREDDDDDNNSNNNNNNNSLDILVLEARDRVGGRIHSVKHSIQTTTKDNDEAVVVVVVVTIDHGAAWVHGTGYDWPISISSSSTEAAAALDNDDGDDDIEQHHHAIPQPNPMMELLLEAVGSTRELYRHHLKPTCRRGNPWMRPQHVLHDSCELVLFVAGQRLDSDNPLITESLTRNKEIFQAVSRIGNNMYDSGRGMDTTTISLQQALDRIETESDVNHDELLINALIQFHRYLMTVWYGCPMSQLQLSEFTVDDDDDRVMNEHTYTEEGDFYGPHCTLRHGMQTVLEPLLSQQVAGDQILRLNQEVIRIADSHRDDTVTVTTRSGLQVEADCCVVTIPIGCLQHAVRKQEDHDDHDHDDHDHDGMFQPPLSANKVEAIHAMRMGGYKKVLLTFDYIFWPKEPVMIGMIRRLESKNEEKVESPLGNYLLFDNLWACDGIACIEAILTCDAADWATGKGDAVIRQAVLRFMGDAMSLPYGDLDSQCIDCHVTRWEEDQFSRGAYSSYKLGTLERHTEELRTPEWNQKLFFAGEATIPEFEGSVHAALFSGKDVADRVQEYLKSRQAAKNG